MHIEVLGTSCPNCLRFYDSVKQVAAELELAAKLSYVNDFAQIIERGLYTSPVLVVDGQVLLKGGGHSAAVIRQALSSLAVMAQPESVADDCPYCLSI